MEDVPTTAKGRWSDEHQTFSGGGGMKGKVRFHSDRLIPAFLGFVAWKILSLAIWMDEKFTFIMIKNPGDRP
jgi:hypothetical protein